MGLIVLQPWRVVMGLVWALALGLYIACCWWANSVKVARSIAADAEEELEAYRDINKYMLTAMDDRDERSVARRRAIQAAYEARGDR